MISPSGDRSGPVSANSRVHRFTVSQRGWLRVVIVSLLFLGTSVGLVAWVESEQSTERIRQLLIREGSSLLGEDLYIQKLSIEQIVPPTVSLGGVTVHSRDSKRGGQPLLRVDSINVRFGNPVGLLSRRLDFDAVVLTRPSLRVAVEDGKLRDFEALAARLTEPRRDDALKLWLG